MTDTIFLIGYMGSGKTVVGKSLSKSINYDFYDLDNFIENMEKKKISEIFNDYNEVYFRKLENKYLKILSQKNESKIISLGCLLYTSPSPRDATLSRMPSSA